MRPLFFVHGEAPSTIPKDSALDKVVMPCPCSHACQLCAMQGLFLFLKFPIDGLTEFVIYYAPSRQESGNPKVGARILVMTKQKETTQWA